MKLKKFLKGISLMEEASKQVLSCSVPELDYLQYKDRFQNELPEFIKEAGKLTENPEGLRLLLYLYARLCCDAWDQYREQGIEEKVYWDTFQDLTIWCRTCKMNDGVYGIHEYDWLWRHAGLQLFRLGRLQFERFFLSEDIETGDIHGKKGEPVLNVHIPEGGPLNEEECRKSFCKAVSFFRGEFLFICHSWLLYPGLKEVLPEGSNILKFQKFFKIWELDVKSREAEERVFLHKKENPAEYPEDTGLQRAMKRKLMEGLHFGSAYGILKWNKCRMQDNEQATQILSRAVGNIQIDEIEGSTNIDEL